MSDINPNRMIPLHVADQAVESCNREIAELKADVERSTAQYNGIIDTQLKVIDKLKAEVERLRASSFVTAVPVEQYERLLKAGDAMADAINEHRHGKGGAWGEGFIVREKWKTAKEGKPKNSKDALEFIHTLDSLAIKKQKEEIERLCAWGRGLESDLSHARVEISFLKAESERLKEDNRQLTNAFEIAEGIIKRMGKAAEDAAKEGKPSV